MLGPKYDLAYLYNPTLVKMKPEFSLKQKNDSILQLHYRFLNRDIYQVSDSSIMDSVPKLNFKFEIYDFQFLLNDSSSYSILLENYPKEKYLSGSARINKHKLKEAYLLIKIENTLNRNLFHKLFIVDSSLNTFTQKNFWPAHGKLLSYRNIYDSLSYINLSPLNNDSIWISYYKPQVKLYKSTLTDSVPEIYLRPDTLYKWYFPEFFNMSKEGKYIIKPDSISTDSLCFFNFGINYNRLNKVDQLIGPLQYIAKNKEFENLQEAKNPKLAHDNFWLKKTIEIQPARELIRIYYTRTFFSNIYFTSDREGWKTDRGMVYIVYGIPYSIYLSGNTEVWYYGNPNRKGHTKFVFKKVFNPCSSNDFRLVRNKNINSQWRKAIQSWQDGKVYNVRNFK